MKKLLVYFVLVTIMFLFSSCYIGYYDRVEFRVVNNIGNNYRIDYVIFQPSGLSSDPIMGNDGLPLYDYMPFNWTLDYGEGYTFTTFTNNGVKYLDEGYYDIYVFATALNEYQTYLFSYDHKNKYLSNGYYSWRVNWKDSLVVNSGIFFKSKK